MSCLLHETIIYPQGVEHGIITQFTKNYKNLITTNKNQLIMYNIKETGLEIQLKEILEGNIIQIESIKVNDEMLLILLFKEAKVSIMRYNEEQNIFKIKSLHCFEHENKRIREKFTTTTYNDPRLLIDKRGRCISLICYDRMMWVIPLEYENANSFQIEIEKFGINRIIDCIVLDGYELPTIAFLHRRMPTCQSRIVDTGVSTNELTFISINQNGEDKAILTYKFEYLPFNTLQILDCYPLNGVLILTINSLFYLSTTSNESYVLPFSLNHIII